MVEGEEHGCLVCGIRQNCAWFKEIVLNGCKEGQFPLKEWRRISKGQPIVYEEKKKPQMPYQKTYTRPEPTTLPPKRRVLFLWYAWMRDMLSAKGK